MQVLVRLSPLVIPADRWPTGPVSTHPTSAALHSAAVQLIEQHGEDGVTVEMVLAQAGASKGSLYHHYRDFGSLLDRAQATRFETAAAATAAALDAEPSGSRDELLRVLVRVAAGTLSPYDDSVRTSVLAAADRRPSLLVLLEPAQRRLGAHVAALVRVGQTRRWLRADLDAAQVAALLLACAAGRVVGSVAGEVPASWQTLVADVVVPMLEPAVGDPAVAMAAEIPEARRPGVVEPQA